MSGNTRDGKCQDRLLPSESSQAAGSSGVVKGVVLGCGQRAVAHRGASGELPGQPEIHLAQIKGEGDGWWMMDG